MSMAADVVVFDPASVGPQEPKLAHDLPGGDARLVQQSQGIHHVLVNGEVLLENGELTGVRPGRVMRGGSASAG